MKSISSPVYKLHLLAANHSSVEDWDYLNAKSSGERNSAAGRLQLIRKYLVAFLGTHLRSESSDLLEHDASTPESEFKAYRPGSYSPAH